MTSSLDKPVDLKHYSRMIWRRKGIIALCAITTLCAALVALAIVPREYESGVTLMIDDSQLLSRELEKVMGGIMQPPTGYGVDQERMAKMVGRIESRPFLERVIRMLRMNEDPLIRAQAERACKSHPEIDTEEMAIRILVKNLQSRIRFSSAGSGVYKVIVADYSAQNARILANWISELFVDTSNQTNMERIKAGHEFGVEQLRIYEEQLRRSEEVLKNYKQSTIAKTLAASSVRSDNLTVAEVYCRRVEDEASATRIRMKPYALALATEADPTALLDDPRVKDLAGSLSAALRNELADRLAGHGGEVGGWPPDGTYGAIRRGLLPQVEAVASRYYPKASSETLSALARFVFSKTDLDAQLDAAEMLQGAIAAFKRQAGAEPGGEIELARLEREVETNRGLLQSFQAQLVGSDVSRAVEMTKVGLKIEILDPANQPLAPSRPDQAKILLAALFLGPLLGVGFAFLSEVVDPTLRSLEDFARVAPEPVLGTTPLLTPFVSRQRWIRRYWVQATVTGVVLLTLIFLVVRTSLLHDLIAKGVPVHLVNPEKVLNEDSR